MCNKQINRFGWRFNKDEVINEIQIMENAEQKSKEESEERKMRIIQYAIDLNNYKLSLVVVIVLIIIQNIQLISMGVVTPISMSSFGLDQFRKVAQVFYPEYYLRSSRLALYLVPICFLFSAFHACLLIYTFKKESRLKIIVHYFFILFSNVTAAPCAITNVATLVCISGNPFAHNFSCFTGIHILYVIFSILNISWLIFCTLFVFLFYINPNPFCYQYFTCSSNLWMLAKFLIKIAPVIFLVIDPNLKFDVLYIVSFAGINFVSFVAFKLMWPYSINHSLLQNFVVRCDLIVIIVTAFFIPLRFFYSQHQNNCVFLISFLIAILLGQFVIQIFNFKKTRLLDIFMESGEQQEDAQKYQQFFYDLIKKIQHRNLKHPQLIGLLKLHEKSCKDNQCSCIQINKAYSKQQNYSISDETIIYTFINRLIQQIIDKLKNTTNLKIISGYISYEKLNQKTKSIYLLSDLLSSNKISFKQQISIRRLYFKFRVSDNSVTVLSKYKQFSQHLWEFQRRAEIATQNCRKYWIELIQQDCEISKIWNMANIVQKDKEYLNYLVNAKLLKIFPNNLYILRLYSQLLSSVFRVPYHSIDKYLSAFQLGSITPDQLPENKQKILFRENEEMSVMCAVQNDGIFEFIRVNSNIIDIFQTRNVQFLHKNINTIIPQVYQQFHDKKIKQYLLQTDNKIQQRNGKIFIIDANQNLTHCIYKVKILFSEKYGLQFVCFIRKISKNGPKKKFMSYMIDESLLKQNGKNQVRGDVIHIDPELKQFFYGQENEQFSQKYYGKIEDLLPEWDIESEELIISDQNESSLHLFSKIELAQTDNLQQGICVKYLAFTYRMQIPRLTIQPIRQTSSPSIIKRQSNLKDSFWSQTSHSRLNLLDYNQKSCEPDSSITYNSPFQLNQKFMKIVGVAILSTFVVISIVMFSFGFEEKQIQKNDFEIIELSTQLSKCVSRIGIQIKKSIFGELNQLFDKNLIDIISKNVKAIYEIMGNHYIDPKLVVSISIYEQSKLVNEIQSTFNNAVSFLISTASLMVQNPYPIDAFTNFFKNVSPILQACTKVSNVSSQFAVNRLRNIALREIAFNCIQAFVIIFITVLLIYRICTIYSYSYSVLMIYQNSLQIQQLRAFVFKCSKFVQKVKGVYTEESSYKKQKFKMIVMQLQHLAPPQQPLRISYENAEMQQQNDQQQKLMQMKKKISFQQYPSRLKYLIFSFITFVVYLVVKININFSNPNHNFVKQKIQRRQIINLQFQIQSKLQMMLSELASESLLKDKDNNLVAVLNKIDGEIMMLGNGDKLISNEVNLLKIYQIITQLKLNSEQVNFFNIQKETMISQKQLWDRSQRDLNSEISKISPRRSGLVLALEIFLSFIVIVAFYKIICQQQKIRIGCTLMMEMLGQSKSGNRVEQDKSISLNNSVRM